MFKHLEVPMHQNAPDRIQTHPNASDKFRSHPKTSARIEMQAKDMDSRNGKLHFPDMFQYMIRNNVRNVPLVESTQLLIPT